MTLDIVAQDVDLSALSVDELKALRRRWFTEARENGTIAAIGRVVRELGTRHPKKHGANWVWKAEDVQIVLDDYTGHTYVSAGERQVFASNYTSELFVPGPWVDVVLAAAVGASGQVKTRRSQAIAAERDELLHQLGGM